MEHVDGGPDCLEELFVDRILQLKSFCTNYVSEALVECLSSPVLDPPSQPSLVCDFDWVNVILEAAEKLQLVRTNLMNVISSIGQAQKPKDFLRKDNRAVVTSSGPLLKLVTVCSFLQKLSSDVASTAHSLEPRFQNSVRSDPPESALKVFDLAENTSRQISTLQSISLPMETNLAGLGPMTIKSTCDAQVQCDFTPEKSSGTVDLFVRHLDESIDNDVLYEEFEPFGKVLSTRVLMNDEGQSKGYGFVTFSCLQVDAMIRQTLNG
jgi:hypothetical protein